MSNRAIRISKVALTVAVPSLTLVLMTTQAFAGHQVSPSSFVRPTPLGQRGSDLVTGDAIHASLSGQRGSDLVDTTSAIRTSLSGQRGSDLVDTASAIRTSLSGQRGSDLVDTASAIRTSLSGQRGSDALSGQGAKTNENVVSASSLGAEAVLVPLNLDSEQKRLADCPIR